MRPQNSLLYFIAFSCSLLYSCEFRCNTMQNSLSLLGISDSCSMLQTNSLTSPYIPQHIQLTQERAQYLLKHFWDKKNLADTTLIGRKEIEQNYMDYCGLLVSFPAESVKEYIVYPLEQNHGEMLLYTLSIYQSMLHNTNSPVASEDHYRYVLEWATRSPKIKDLHQEKAKNLLSLINKNRVGYTVEDFIYTKIDGSRHHLRNFRSARTLLILISTNNPTHTELINQIADQPDIAKLLKNKQLDIKVIYLQTSVEQFISDSQQLPQAFEAGHDAENKILTDQLYDIKPYPTMYLIDHKGQVLLKDVSLEQLESYLHYCN